MGYRIYYNEGANMGSEDAGASATDHNLTFPYPQSRLNYSITIVAVSSHLPSTVVGPALVIVGKQKTACFTVLYIRTYVKST